MNILKLENTGIDDMQIDLKPLSKVLGLHAFIRGESWDYERITYDYKIGSNEKNISYYIRIQAYAIEGDIDRADAVVKIMPPLLGKHYYPHGIEYGEDAEFSKNLIERATGLVKNAAKDLQKYAK